MSNQTSGTPSRRRRIAGERRPREGEPTTQLAEPDTRVADPTDRAAGPVETADRVTEPAETTESTTPDREPRAVPTRALAALAVAALLLVAFAASGFGLDGVGVQAWRAAEDQSQVESAQRSAPAAAERAAAAILAYSHDSLEADRDNAARFMTPSYRKEYLDTFGLVLDSAPAVKAVVEAEVRASGVAHADPDRVNVLLFVNQTTTSTANDQPQTALNRVMMTMQRTDDGGWLVDDITSY